MQGNFDLAVYAKPTGSGSSFSTVVRELVEKKGVKNSSASAIITFITIPEVGTAISNLTNYLNSNCLFKNQLGQFVISEKVLKEAEKRKNEFNAKIESAVSDIVSNYSDIRDKFQVDMEAYLISQLGKKNSKLVLKKVMSKYPTVSDVQQASIRLKLDYVQGKAGLSENSISLIDESKAFDAAEAYQNMVLNAITPVYQKLGVLLEQEINDGEMSERSINAYRNGIKRLQEDNIILGNPSLTNICKVGFIAVHSSDKAEMLITCIYRLAKEAGVERSLPEIQHYTTETMNKLAADNDMPSLEELIFKSEQKKKDEEEESNE